MQRLGLCCLFRTSPIRFRTTTAAYIGRCAAQGTLPEEILSKIIVDNVDNLLQAIIRCEQLGIGAFRITSRLFPLYTHPEFGYRLDDLPEKDTILKGLKRVKKEAVERSVRLSFHPDQFVVLNSPSPSVVEKSLQELEYHGLMAHLLGADVINLHGGGGYGDKQAALERFARAYEQLSPRVQQRLTVENDDVTYTPQELWPLCRQLQIPLVYDVHHHRCLHDGWTVEEATEKALMTWSREPLFHVSSPKGGWKSANPAFHDDYINPDDVPHCWKTIDPLTIDVEAKAKEVAVVNLRKCLLKQGWKIGE